MSAFRNLSAFVREAADAARAAGLAPGDDLRSSAAALALALHGERVVAEVGSVVNVAALALASLERLVVHEVRPAVCTLVDETDLHSLPAEAPRLLRRTWLLEAKRPETGDRLFGDTVALGGYQLDGTTYLVGLDYPDGARVATWRPTWGEGEIAAGTEQSWSAMVPSTSEQEGWTRDAARFAIVLGILLDAEGAPLRIDDEREHPAAPKAKGREPKPAPVWITRRVYLDDRRPRAAASPGAAVGAVAGDRLESRASVTGHLKRQPCGPGGRDRKWIWVDGYEARRWVAPRPTRIVVSTRGDGQ